MNYHSLRTLPRKCHFLYLSGFAHLLRHSQNLPLRVQKWSGSVVSLILSFTVWFYWPFFIHLYGPVWFFALHHIQSGCLRSLPSIIDISLIGHLKQVVLSNLSAALSDVLPLREDLYGGLPITVSTIASQTKMGMLIHLSKEIFGIVICFGF